MAAPDLQTVAVTKMGTAEQAGGQRFANPCPPARPAFSVGQNDQLMLAKCQLDTLPTSPYKGELRCFAEYVRTQQADFSVRTYAVKDRKRTI